MTQTPEVIIVGAGVMGPALAYALANDGRKVLLIEKNWEEPDRIVGELLQPGGVEALQELGLVDCIEGIDGIPVDGYGVLYQGEAVQIPYPKNSKGQTIKGKAFHHGRFVMKLREAAKSCPNVTAIEATVNSLIKDKTGRVTGVSCTQKYDNEERVVEYFAPLTFVADGIFSKFRKEYLPVQPKLRSHFVGFVMKNTTLPYPRHGHVILAKDTPILMYQIGANEVRVLIDFRGKLPNIPNGEMKQYLLEHILPEVPKEVQSGFKDGVENDRIRSMTNSFLPPTRNIHRGVILIGDAMNMRHPLTGGGMTVTFWDAVHVANLLSKDTVPDLNDTALVIQQMKKHHWNRKSRASMINILAMALYSLFSAPENSDNLRILQLSCFKYFQLGGIAVSGPIGLLAGLIPNPLVLMFHFYAVAFYGILYQVLLAPMLPASAAPTSGQFKHVTSGSCCSRMNITPGTVALTVAYLPLNTIKAVSVLYTACVVFLPLVWSELC
ncbi:SE-domain-containing protein [Basidiobolus meristosporus CBS 931.73]|uniref:Squalene monooxygenase n=1 Tax=Basidiobolus meristosporus CBS 931.73 TaxID=1314790 RepID=A0A1Y1YXL1_9FUNG|nr:SE-domain-containing protein [Basidiobolus meristosporus CBS 931.73]|eukprot:ORY02614.1 SE-domain-containing protein [Basidiobolus meristosporus CBS 931.73]